MPEPPLSPSAVFRGDPTGATVLDYWRWSASNLLDNVQRGVVAEFLVARALGVADAPREEWAGWDISYPFKSEEDPIKIEVKSSAYSQSWHQDDAYTISYDIGRRTWVWDPKTGKSEKLDSPQRTADMYVFALLRRDDQRDRSNPNENKPDPLDLSHWEFHVLDRATLDQQVSNQKSIGLNPLKKLVESWGRSVQYANLKAAVDDLCRVVPRRTISSARSH